jgi:hypothetical protein
MRLADGADKLNGKSAAFAHLTLRGTIAALAKNAQEVAAYDADSQDAILEAWDHHGCRNAHQAIAHAGREHRHGRNVQLTLDSKQAKAKSVRGDVCAAEPGDTASGRRHRGRREVSGGVVFHV